MESETDLAIAESDLALVLKHYAKLTAPKVSRAGRYKKGRAFEYELRDHFTSHGLKCRRVMQSGGGVEKDDLVLTTGWGEEYRLEAKRVAKLPAYLLNPQCHATVFRMDRGESLVLVSLQRFTELAQ
jgi:Holliday junction resolvase